MSKGRQKPGREFTRVQVYRAGCGRKWKVASTEADLAYTEQAFAECPICPHRVDPEGAPPFCTLRPVNTAHPFAALAELNLEQGQ